MNLLNILSWMVEAFLSKALSVPGSASESSLLLGDIKTGVGSLGLRNLLVSLLGAQIGFLESLDMLIICSSFSFC